MVMPYVSGGAVSSILHHRHPAGFLEAAIAGVASGVLSALKCLHEAGVMHRDIKVECLDSTPGISNLMAVQRCSCKCRIHDLMP